MHLVLMCRGPSLYLCAHYAEAGALRGPPQPRGRREPSPVATEPTETLNATLIKHEKTISWLINRGKTPAFVLTAQAEGPSGARRQI